MPILWLLLVLGMLAAGLGIQITPKYFPNQRGARVHIVSVFVISFWYFVFFLSTV